MNAIRLIAYLAASLTLTYLGLRLLNPTDPRDKDSR